METPPLDLALVLALHAPYVDAPHRHLTEPNALGDALWAWVSESLVPLLNALERLEREQVEAPLSLAISPVLCEMLADIEFAPGYLKYLERQAANARGHAQLFASRGQDLYRDMAAFWEAWYQDAERDFRESYALDLLGALRDFQSRGRIELLAMPATVAPLPLLARDASVQAQLAVAVEAFKQHFGRAPRGLWTCRGLERAEEPRAQGSHKIAKRIAAAGFDYVVEGEATTSPSEVERDGGTRYQAHRLPWLLDVLPSIECRGLPTDESALQLRGSLGCVRAHAAASEQAWHPSGYAGEERFLCSSRRCFPGGLRLWRNTREGTSSSRLEAYQSSGTSAICEAQAAHWLDRLHEWAAQSNSRQQCVAFDATLFGSLWFEGHAWLARVLKHAAQDTRFRLRLASHALTLDSLAAQSGAEAVAQAEEPGSGATVWCNRRNAQLWPEVHSCEVTMEEWAVSCAGTPNPKLREILNQCARELLLIQSSDWPLLLASAPPQPEREREREQDARSRLAEHLEAFRHLISIAATVQQGEFLSEGQRAYLDALRTRDDVFPHIAFTLWAEL